MTRWKLGFWPEILRLAATVCFALVIGAYFVPRAQKMIFATRYEARHAGYIRPQWQRAGSCRDTRALVLSSLCSSTTWDVSGCHVQAAVCPDLYSGAEIATDSAQAIQIDHLVSAHTAWMRRTWHRTDGSVCKRADRCEEYGGFFDDLANLVPTRARTNEHKGDRGPDAWCPENVAARADLARRYRAVSKAWDIPLTSNEAKALQSWDRGECFGARP